MTINIAAIQPLVPLIAGILIPVDPEVTIQKSAPIGQ